MLKMIHDIQITNRHQFLMSADRMIVWFRCSQNGAGANPAGDPPNTVSLAIFILWYVIELLMVSSYILGLHPLYFL